MPKGVALGMLKFRIDRCISLQSQLKDETSLLVAATIGYESYHEIQARETVTR